MWTGCWNNLSLFTPLPQFCKCYIYPPGRCFNNKRQHVPSCDASVVKLLLNGDESLDLETNTLILNATVEFIHSHKKRIVWKYRPNWPFDALMLRTKLYQNPFFSTGYQNLNKPKSRAVRTVYGLIFLRFYKISVSFFLFYVKM